MLAAKDTNADHGSSLTTEDSAELAALESVIGAWRARREAERRLEVTMALMKGRELAKIRDSVSYLRTHRTFALFCRAEYSISVSRAQQLIKWWRWSAEMHPSAAAALDADDAADAVREAEDRAASALV